MSSPEPPKIVTTKTQVVESVPWFRQSSMILALTTVAGGLYSVSVGLCELGVVCIKLSEKGFISLITGLAITGGGLVWGYKRVRQGADPASPLSKITLT